VLAILVPRNWCSSGCGLIDFWSTFSTCCTRSIEPDDGRHVRATGVRWTLALKSRSTPATMSKQRSTLLPKTARMSNEFCVEISSFPQSRTLLRQCFPKRQHCRSNRQQSCLLLRQCCFDIVASVNRALAYQFARWRHYDRSYCLDCRLVIKVRVMPPPQL